MPISLLRIKDERTFNDVIYDWIQRFSINIFINIIKKRDDLLTSYIEENN